MDTETAGAVHRIANFLEDCCECGGSIKYGEHAEDCTHTAEGAAFLDNGVLSGSRR